MAIYSAFMADPDPITQALGHSLYFLWNDLRPEDNERTFTVSAPWE